MAKKANKTVFFLLVICNVGCLAVSALTQNLLLGVFALGFALYLKRINREIPVPRMFRKG